MTRFGDADLCLSELWQPVAHQTEHLEWDWIIDATTTAALLSASDAGRVITAQQRCPRTGRMRLLAKLAAHQSGRRAA